LAHQIGLLTAQHRLAALQRLLDLTKAQLNLPALAIALRQIFGTVALRIHKRGDKAPCLASQLNLYQPGLPSRWQMRVKLPRSG
jgi:hypothetical protein